MSATNTIAVPDTVGNVGKYTSLTLDSLDNPVIAYYDVTNGNLKVLHCDTPSCMGSASIESPDSVGDVGRYTSIVLDWSGFPVIAYYDVTNQDLRLLHCGDADCASGNTVASPDVTGNLGVVPSIQLDADGNPVIAHYDLGNMDLRLVHCGNPACTAGNSLTTVDAMGDVGDYPSLALDINGNPVISYFDRTNGDVKIAHCNDSDCLGGDESITSADTAEVVGAYSSLVLDDSGFPVVSYWDLTNQDVKLLRCGDANCDVDNTLTSLDSTANVGAFTSLELDTVGRPVISYWDSVNGDLKVIHCGNQDCTDPTQPILAVDTSGTVGLYSSLAITSIGVPVVSYYDIGNGDLHVASCPNCDLDSDGDGCTDAQEAGADASQGGQRDPQNPWDFYDVLGASNGPPDGVIDLSNDILGVILEYAPNGYTVGAADHTGTTTIEHYDRGPRNGGSQWNLSAPDGAIDLANDILGVILQYGHRCD